MTKKSCLVLHGFSGSPFEVESIISVLKSEGFTVSAPCLPGHTNEADFQKHSFKDWYAYAEAELEQLQKTSSKVYIAGFSMGAAMALLLAQRYQIDGIACLASPLYAGFDCLVELRKIKPLFLPLVMRYKPCILLAPHSLEEKSIAPIHNPCEGKLYLRPLHSFLQNLPAIRRKLHLITAPALIIHDLHDRTCPAKASVEIAQKISSQHIELHFTNITETITNKHMLPTHQETKEFVAHAVAHFFSSLP